MIVQWCPIVLVALVWSSGSGSNRSRNNQCLATNRPDFHITHIDSYKFGKCDLAYRYLIFVSFIMLKLVSCRCIISQKNMMEHRLVKKNTRKWNNCMGLNYYWQMRTTEGMVVQNCTDYMPPSVWESWASTICNKLPLLIVYRPIDIRNWNCDGLWTSSRRRIIIKNMVESQVVMSQELQYKKLYIAIAIHTYI